MEELEAGDFEDDDSSSSPQNNTQISFSFAIDPNFCSIDLSKWKGI